MKKTIVCLYGGPGSGKSTTAAGLFYQAKLAGVNAELVREYAKELVWEYGEVIPEHQEQLAYEQANREEVLHSQVDLIITDSPLRLGLYYEDNYTPRPEPVFAEVMVGVERRAAEHGYTYLHVMLTRFKSYEPKGRLHNRDEAIAIDHVIRDKYLPEDHVEVRGDHNAVGEIFNILFPDNLQF